MGRQSAVTVEEVINAAQQLIEAGRTPTKTGIRDIVGHGRPDNCMALYNAYIEENGPLTLPVPVEEPVQIEQAELPSVLADRLSVLLPELMAQIEGIATEANQIANSVHSKRVNKEVLEARAKREAADREVEEVTDKLNDCYNEIEDQAEEILRLSESDTTLKQEVARLKEQLTQSERRGDQLADELRDCRKDIEGKAGEIKRLQHDLTVANEQNSQLTQTLDSERESHKQTLESERQAHQQAQEQADNALKTCQKQLQDAQDAHHQAETDKAGLTAELNAAYAANEQLKLSHQSLIETKEQQLSQQAGQLQELQQQHQATEQALTDSQAKCAELDKDLALAQSKADEVPALREKNESLQAQLLQLATERQENGSSKDK